MFKLTEEMLNKIKESGVPIVDITLEGLSKAEVVTPDKE
jgi:hypothetical protein